MGGSGSGPTRAEPPRAGRLAAQRVEPQVVAVLKALVATLYGERGRELDLVGAGLGRVGIAPVGEHVDVAAQLAVGEERVDCVGMGRRTVAGLQRQQVRVEHLAWRR